MIVDVIKKLEEDKEDIQQAMYSIYKAQQVRRDSISELDSRLAELRADVSLNESSYNSLGKERDEIDVILKRLRTFLPQEPEEEPEEETEETDEPKEPEVEVGDTEDESEEVEEPESPGRPIQPPIIEIPDEEPIEQEEDEEPEEDVENDSQGDLDPTDEVLGEDEGIHTEDVETTDDDAVETPDEIAEEIVEEGDSPDEEE